jgi:hypothetical protein
MSFSYQKLVQAHKASGEKSIDFAHAIFGPDSKLGPEYFKTKKSISTFHLERMCAHFKLPMNYFFDETPISVYNIGNVVKNNGVGVGNVNINNDVEHLKETIKQLESVIEDKNEQIKWLKSQWDSVLKTFQNIAK